MIGRVAGRPLTSGASRRKRGTCATRLRIRGSRGRISALRPPCRSKKVLKRSIDGFRPHPRFAETARVRSSGSSSWSSCRRVPRDPKRPPVGTLEPDKFLFERGTEELNKKHWLTAREYFRQLNDSYPAEPVPG